MTYATSKANGCKVDCARGYVRFPFTLSAAELAALKAIALKNNRSISAEIRMRLKLSLFQDSLLTERAG